jgi:hypothetical protein
LESRNWLVDNQEREKSAQAVGIGKFVMFLDDCPFAKAKAVTIVWRRIRRCGV